MIPKFILQTGRILDIGATNDEGAVFHSPSLNDLTAFIASSPFICGHNIIDHDRVHLEKWMGREKLSHFQFIDTLFLSALLFPEKPYHKLSDDGYQALPYHDKMESRQKTMNQNAFMAGEVTNLIHHK